MTISKLSNQAADKIKILKYQNIHLSLLVHDTEVVASYIWWFVVHCRSTKNAPKVDSWTGSHDASGFWGGHGAL